MNQEADIKNLETHQKPASKIASSVRNECDRIFKSLITDRLLNKLSEVFQLLEDDTSGVRGSIDLVREQIINLLDIQKVEGVDLEQEANIKAMYLNQAPNLERIAKHQAYIKENLKTGKKYGNYLNLLYADFDSILNDISTNRRELTNKITDQDLTKVVNIINEINTLIDYLKNGISSDLITHQYENTNIFDFIVDTPLAVKSSPTVAEKRAATYKLGNPLTERLAQSRQATILAEQKKEKRRRTDLIF